MPQNMQRRPKVAELEIEERESEQEIEKKELPSDDTLYAIALRYLERGMQKKEIIRHLADMGMSRFEARKLAEQVWAENAEARRTNAYILLGASAVFGLPGILLLILNMMDFGTFSLLTPSYLLIFVGAWLLYKGVQAYRKANG